MCNDNNYDTRDEANYDLDCCAWCFAAMVANDGNPHYPYCSSACAASAAADDDNGDAS